MTKQQQTTIMEQLLRKAKIHCSIEALEHLLAVYKRLKINGRTIYIEPEEIKVILLTLSNLKDQLVDLQNMAKERETPG